MVSKQLKGGEGNITLQWMVRDLEHVKKGQCLHLLLPEHSGHPFDQPVSRGTEGQTHCKAALLPPPNKNNHCPGYTSPCQAVWGSLQGRPRWLFPAQGRGASLVVPENPPPAKQGLPPPLWWEAFNPDPFST